MGRCPGQDTRNLTISYHPCPHCSKPVEFFSDEMRLKCPHCGGEVVKEETPNCIMWCEAARECLGPELYDQIMSRMKQTSGDAGTKAE